MYGIIIHDIKNITQEATLKDQHGRTRLGGIGVHTLSPSLETQRGSTYYPPEVSSMEDCCLGVFRREYFSLVTN